MTQTQSPSKAAKITGWVFTGLMIAFYLFDAGGKIAMEQHHVAGSTALGWPADKIQTIGYILLVCTILYAIPRTTVLGAVLITGYLGGAVAVMMRTPGQQFYFPFIFGALTWAGVYFRNTKLQALVKGL
ncbi:DoxX family protein [Mucilaginibacter pedocola]|uniref:DoxX family protein n=1 Tax=Mucilaginibacter pedocola TaxID=1792845 RepID=A0A1S9PD94_9SPHI|nr:DoxX family protein [Mucilaginibacter pedocola]OOQ58925.1 hypothetical protein BC343_08645 [Mucilaginibacter pedocola]